MDIPFTRMILFYGSWVISFENFEHRLRLHKITLNPFQHFWKVEFRTSLCSTFRRQAKRAAHKVT